MADLTALTKEVFALFGEAYCQSDILHRGLCNLYALATFDKAESVTGPRVQEKLAWAFSLTLGQVIEKLKGLVPENIQQQLDSALAKRNYLAHRFWYERNHLMFDERGLRAVQQELSDMLSMFHQLDETITEYFAPIRHSFGVSDQLVRQLYAKMLAGEPDEPMISQRMLRKKERLITVWDVRHADKRQSLIFETEDGCLWQLCDVGLGWSTFEKPCTNWVINESLQKYLPATINPRPTGTPWNYEFELTHGAVLWVRPGKRQKTFAWGIRVRSDKSS